MPKATTFATSTSRNSFERNKLRKWEKALGEYLCTTHMIFQYSGVFTGALGFSFSDLPTPIR